MFSTEHFKYIVQPSGYFRDDDDVNAFLATLRGVLREQFPDGVLTMSQYVAARADFSENKLESAIERAAELMGEKWVREGRIQPWKDGGGVDMGRYMPVFFACMCAGAAVVRPTYEETAAIIRWAVRGDA